MTDCITKAVDRLVALMTISSPAAQFSPPEPPVSSPRTADGCDGATALSSPVAPSASLRRPPWRRRRS